MVIRVVSGKVKLGAEGEFNALMRDVRLPEMRRRRGFVYAKFGRRIEPDGERFVFVSEWRDVGALYEWIGPDLTRPATIAGAEHLVEEYKVELFEAMDVELQPETGEPDTPMDVPAEPPPRGSPQAVD